MRASIVLLASIFSLFLTGNAVAVQLYWDAGGGDSNWANALNWSDNQLPTPGSGGGDDNRVPTIADEISLDGNSVTVSTTEEYNDFNTGATGGSLTISSGGHLTTNGGFHGLFGLSSVTITSGGTLFNVATSSDQIRSATTVGSGGTLEGFTRLRSTLDINGGTFRPFNQTTASTFEIDSTLNLNIGTLELDVFNGGGSGSEMLSVFSGRTLNINNPTGEIVLVPQGGYVPSALDSFRLWDDTPGGAVNFLSDASNVSIQGFPVSWDTSLWASDGILSIEAPAVPEPNTLGLFALAGLFALRRRRRLRS